MDILAVKQLSNVSQFLKSFTSENTRIAYDRDLKDYASFSTGSDPLAFATLAQYRDFLIASSAPATVVRKFSAVKSFFSFLASEGVLKHNPAQNLKVPSGYTKNPTEAFEDAEVVQVLAQPDLTGFSGSMHRIALVMLFNLGLRRSEIANLKIGSFQEHRGIRFLTVDGKGGKQRLIPLSKEIIEEVDAYLVRYRGFTESELSKSDFLLQSFPNVKNAAAVNPSTIFRMVKTYAKAAGVTKRVSPHSCRATMISHLLEKNVSPRSVADLAGHSSIHTTVGIYDRKRDSLTNQTAFKVRYGT